MVSFCCFSSFSFCMFLFVFCFVACFVVFLPKRVSAVCCFISSFFLSFVVSLLLRSLGFCSFFVAFSSSLLFGWFALFVFSCRFVFAVFLCLPLVPFGCVFRLLGCVCFPRVLYVFSAVFVSSAYLGFYLFVHSCCVCFRCSFACLR